MKIYYFYTLRNDCCKYRREFENTKFSNLVDKTVQFNPCVVVELSAWTN